MASFQKISPPPKQSHTTGISTGEEVDRCWLWWCEHVPESVIWMCALCFKIFPSLWSTHHCRAVTRWNLLLKHTTHETSSLFFKITWSHSRLKILANQNHSKALWPSVLVALSLTSDITLCGWLGSKHQLTYFHEKLCTALLLLLKCCFTSTKTVGLLGTGAQDGHLDFHTAPELPNVAMDWNWFLKPIPCSWTHAA